MKIMKILVIFMDGCNLFGYVMFEEINVVLVGQWIMVVCCCDFNSIIFDLVSGVLMIFILSGFEGDDFDLDIEMF